MQVFIAKTLKQKYQKNEVESIMQWPERDKWRKNRIVYTLIFKDTKGSKEPHTF